VIRNKDIEPMLRCALKVIEEVERKLGTMQVTAKHYLTSISHSHHLEF